MQYQLKLTYYVGSVLEDLVTFLANLDLLTSLSACVVLQLSAYGGSVVYTVSYTTDQKEQTTIRVTSEPDLIIEVSKRACCALMERCVTY